MGWPIAGGGIEEGARDGGEPPEPPIKLSRPANDAVDVAEAVEAEGGDMPRGGGGGVGGATVRGAEVPKRSIKSPPPVVGAGAPPPGEPPEPELPIRSSKSMPDAADGVGVGGGGRAGTAAAGAAKSPKSPKLGCWAGAAGAGAEGGDPKSPKSPKLPKPAVGGDAVA